MTGSDEGGGDVQTYSSVPLDRPEIPPREQIVSLAEVAEADFTSFSVCCPHCGAVVCELTLPWERASEVGFEAPCPDCGSALFPATAVAVKGYDGRDPTTRERYDPVPERVVEEFRLAICGYWGQVDRSVADLIESWRREDGWAWANPDEPRYSVRSEHGRLPTQSPAIHSGSVSRGDST